jgi:glycosyltransferase involved in cell wall biosynthesis
LECDSSVKMHGIPVIFPYLSKYLAYGLRVLFHLKWKAYQAHRLGRLIRKLQPDVIHSLEIQGAGYLVSDVRKHYGGQFPPWLVTIWGSDIYLFGRLDEHVNKIKDVLGACNYYSCECQRDVYLARQLGFNGEVLSVMPVTGGFDLERVEELRQPGPTSARRLILLKGYQGWVGRALVGLRAIALCAKELKGYKIAIYLANDDVKVAAELVSKTTGIQIEVVPPSSHDDMLRLFGQARVYIGLNISDGISASLLEAMVMGAFPIQSCTSCADEWIIDGESGFIVPPEDPEPVASAIRRAVHDDQLVDHAAELNAKTAMERLDQSIIQPRVIEMYQNIIAKAPGKHQ